MPAGIRSFGTVPRDTPSAKGDSAKGDGSISALDLEIVLSLFSGPEIVLSLFSVLLFSSGRTQVLGRVGVTTAF